MDNNIETHPVELLLPDGSSIKGQFHIWDWEPEDRNKVRLALEYTGKTLTRTEYDYFTAMIEIRRELETDGILLKCYGASKNVYPSRMALDMGAGWKAYKTTLGQQAKTSDLVSIFESGPDVEPATVEEQKAFHEAWFDSLG